MTCCKRLCVLVTACVILAGLRTALADSAPREVTVNVVAYTSGADGRAAGTCKPVRIAAGPSADGRARVGFFETQVGATGNQWRSSGWMAAVTAAMLSDFDPRATRVSIEYQGGVDGPSAGGVLTVGILAAVRGDTVRKDAAMTGTINPDGGIGPVGGIPHKIDGAAAAGMKLLLIPGDKRFEVDANTNKQVDLVERGRQKGIEVRRVFNIYQAYKLLTGAQLPRPGPADVLRVSPTVQSRMKKTIVRWTDRFTHSLEAYQQLSGNAKYSDEVKAMYEQGIESMQHCKDLLAEGEITAAMWDCAMANAYSYLAMETARCRYTYANLGYRGVVKRLRDNDWLAKDVQEMTRRMRRETPRTLDQLSVYLVACDTYLEGLSLRLMAQTELDNMPEEDSEEALEMVADAAESQILAWLDMRLAGDYLDLQDAYQGIPIPRDAAWHETAEYMFHASSANVAVFDSLIIEPQAKQLSVGADRVRNVLAVKDKSYGLVRVAQIAVMPNLEKYLGDGEALNYGYLAMSIYTHTRAAGLLAKYYSLGAELNEYGMVQRIPRERTLGEWLRQAEEQSRRNIGWLQDSGVDATVCAQMHAIAAVKARRDAAEKLEALHDFWSADVHARVLRILSGLAQRDGPVANEGLAPDEDAASSATASGKSKGK